MVRPFAALHHEAMTDPARIEPILNSEPVDTIRSHEPEKES